MIDNLCPDFNIIKHSKLAKSRPNLGHITMITCLLKLIMSHKKEV